MEYYSTHAKRVKRKRARVSTSSLVVPGAAGKVLGGQGWAVRYDWKAGWFAEIRGDLEEARRYVYLVNEFGADMIDIMKIVGMNSRGCFLLLRLYHHGLKDG